MKAFCASRELKTRDPKLAARLHPNDPQRILRGLEVVEATGRALSDWQADTQEPLLSEPAACSCLRHRATGFMRDDARFEAMLVDGAHRPRLQPFSPAFAPGDGVEGTGRPNSGRCAGEMELETAIAQAQMHTRRYAKRQMTWFRNQMPDWASFKSKITKIISPNLFIYFKKKLTW
ncbi:MAG: hypothetical protein CM15mP21_0540 [Hyphomicrobiales bacterium]|nr:MAG: hypothetical protein CM15mP21_0540 [Hyphomicrobiales bacterium]